MNKEKDTEKEEITGMLKGKIPEETEVEDLAELFKTFGDPTRIRILYVLAASAMCVHDLSQALDMTQSAVSHQLRILKQCRLVKGQRDGKQIIYSMADDHVYSIIMQGREHVLEEH